MPIRLLKALSICFGLILALTGLSSCDLLEGVGQNTGNGTPAVITTPISTVSASARGSNYAYIVSNQLWIVLANAAPQQITSFNDSATPDVYWHTPVWSPADRYLAVIVSAQPASQGGGGCPGPQFGANGALYVLDTSTQHLDKISVPADQADPQASVAQGGYWQSVFWQDATHLLGWYNGPTNGKSGTAGLYSYNLNSHALTLLFSPTSLGVSTLFSQPVQNSKPLLLNLRYSQGYLYYQEVQQPFSANSQLSIERVAPTEKGLPSLVLAQGHEAWCGASPAPYSQPGWDIDSTGHNLVAQLVKGTQSSVETLNLTSGASTQIFTSLPVTTLNHDLTLAWSPSGQAVAAAESHAFSQNGPFCVLLAQPTNLLKYAPSGAGLIIWRPDAQAFTLQNPDLVAAPTTSPAPGAYMYQINQQTQASLLLSNASAFAWG